MISDQIISFIADNYITITLMVFIIVYHKKLIWEPLAGDDNRVQMDEAAKGGILLLTFCSAYAEGTRTHEWALFSDAYWWSLMFALLTIAGMKHLKHLRFHGDKKTTTQEPQGM